MRKLYTILAVVFLTASLFAQSPQKMSYQAVIRNINNQLVPNHAVGMRISILQGSVTGTPVYVETQTPTTNANGLVTIEIGGGSGFDAINWANGIYFIKTETDPLGGTDFTITGTSQLLSVPYALFASKAANGFSGSYNDLTNKPALFNGTWLSLSEKPTTIAGFGITDAFNGTWSSLTGKPTFATIATSGSYNDLANKPTGNGIGDLQYWDGTSWVIVPAGTSGQKLTMNANSIPVWENSSTPSATASDATSVLMNTATLNGIVNANGFSTTVTFEYGLTTSYGSTTTATQSPVTGNTNSSVSKSVSSLLANTTYLFRLRTSNAIGIT